MRNKKPIIISITLIFAALVVVFQLKAKGSKMNGEGLQEFRPVTGTIQNTISSTGTVFPKNRLEVKPPVNGRVEEILVKEGDKVKTGETLALMSSTERAALLDAARNQGEEALKHWEEVYKVIQLISPIDGEVIVAKTQPGQTVTTADAVLVLSDQLIVRAQVDEVDIGKIKLGQKAFVILDAYPDTKIDATVEHIYYESKTVNNVTIYEVDLVSTETPPFFRSGMNATINFVEESRDNALILPEEVILNEKDGTFVLVKQPGQGTVKKAVTLGITADKNVEILSGLDENDVVVMKAEKYTLPKDNTGTNPFLPSRNKKNGNR